MDIIDPQDYDKRIYVVFDPKSDNWSDPYISTAPEFEQFVDVLVNVHTELPQHTHPEDFILYDYGEFAGGKFFLSEEPKIMGTLRQFREPCEQCGKLLATEVANFNSDNLKKEYKREISTK